MKIIDPRTINMADGPFIISKGGGVDLMSKLIRWRTNSWCEHSMLCNKPGLFAWESAANWYGEGPMEDYMVANNCLKFYQLVNMNPLASKALDIYIANRIASPWYKKMYDYFGIVGEAIGLPKIHTPGLEYCSVDSIHALKAISSYLPSSDQLAIGTIPDEENPGFLDNYMVKTPSTFRLYGVYQFGTTVS